MHNRKRSRHDFESSEIDPQNTVLVPGCESQLHEQNSKRLQNPLQRPLKRQPAYFDAHTLLSNLAFTNFAPTANFVEYERETSFVVLCLIDGKQGKEGGGHMYRSLCHILPSLYTACPTLQALAITTSPYRPSAVYSQDLLQILPLVTTTCVDAAIVAELEGFRRAVGGEEEECIAVVDPDGQCVWTSTEVLDRRATDGGAFRDAEGWRREIVSVLRWGGDGDGRGGAGGSDVVMSE